MTSVAESRRVAGLRDVHRPGREVGLLAARIRHVDIAGERQADLICRAQAGDRAAMGLLVQAHDALVFTIVRRYFGHGVDPEELMQEGRMGLMHAILKFDPTREVALCTYAGHWIRHHAGVFLLHNCATIRAPARVRHAWRRMKREGRTLDDMASSPRPADRILAEHVMGVVPVVSLDASDDEHGARLDKVSDDLPLPDEALDAARMSRDLAQLVAEVVHTLPPGEREVVLRRYPLDEARDEESQVEIARGWDGRAVTRQCIQQVEVKALRRLRVRLGARDFQGVLRARRIDVDPPA